MPRYVPLPVPYIEDSQTRRLVEYLQNELASLSSVIEQISEGNLDRTIETPEHPQDGMIRYADGIGWNPTGSATVSARGIYWYNGTSTASYTWKKIIDAA